MKKYDKEYSTQYVPEVEYLKQHGIRYTFIKEINGVSTYKYAKTPWTAKYKDVFKGTTGCPHCRSSIGEFNIATYLNDNNINYIRQHYFPDCKNEEPLRFDFYLPDYNTVIEFQGEQHYFPVNFSGHRSKEELDQQFEYTKLRDNIKRKYCKSQGIQMVEIPYWDKNKVNLYLDDVI